MMAIFLGIYIHFMCCCFLYMYSLNMNFDVNNISSNFIKYNNPHFGKQILKRNLKLQKCDCRISDVYDFFVPSHFGHMQLWIWRSNEPNETGHSNIFLDHIKNNHGYIHRSAVFSCSFLFTRFPDVSSAFSIFVIIPSIPVVT